MIEIQKDGKYSYSIDLEPNFQNFQMAVQDLHLEKKKVCIVTDSNVSTLYAKELQEVLQGLCAKVVLFVFPAGEENKNLDTVKKLYEFLIVEKFDRKDMLVALGGGVVGDLTGFTAATYLRGIDFIQVPTTLLAQVDSSIGGKTGVDFDSYKNMVGAFHMPRLVYMNLNTLQTLSERQFAAGMAEIIKHGMIQDIDYYQYLISHKKKIENRDYETLKQMVTRSCEIKGYVVETDPTELGIRAWLNFGHTIGHAVEKLKNFELLHGECVALGMVAALWISWKQNRIAKEELQEAEKLLKSYQLPIRVSGLDAEQVLAATKSDKKMEAGAIKFVLLKKMGEAFVNKEVTEEELLGAIQYISEEQ